MKKLSYRVIRHKSVVGRHQFLVQDQEGNEYLTPHGEKALLQRRRASRRAKQARKVNRGR